MREEYWVSFIRQDKEGQMPYLIAITGYYATFEEAMGVIAKVRETSRVLSAWVDVYFGDGYDNKATVFHECYLTSVGTLKGGHK